MWTLVWLVTMLYGGPDGKEPTDRLVPANWQGNPWGPEATKARELGTIPSIPFSPYMKEWDAWGKTVLRDGDILFRRADARVLFGRFPFSRFIANASGSPFSHTGIVALEKGEPVVYDTTKAGVRRQPFAVWMLDNVGAFGVKRVKPEHQAVAPAAVRFCRDLFERQVPFDYDLGLDDSAYYCVEMTEKAYRFSGLPLSEPVRLGDMERVVDYPVCVFVFMRLTHLTLEQAAYFPGNDRHGIWSCPQLQTVFFVPAKPAPPRVRRPAATAPSSSPPRAKPAVTDQKSVNRAAVNPS